MMTEPTTPAPQPSAPADRDLRDRITHALLTTPRNGWTYEAGQEMWYHHGTSNAPGHSYAISCALCMNDVDTLADAVLAVLPAHADRDAVLREAADALDESESLRDLTDDHMHDVNAAANELRRMADEHGPAPDPTRSVLDEVHAERCRQNEKWGEQNHPDVDPRDIPYVTHSYYASRADIWRQVNEERTKPSRSLGRCTGHPEGPHPHTAWDGVLLEEAYEALAEEDPARLRAELIQVAAVAVAWVEAIDRRPAAPAEGTDR
ncbi:hypothetical protein AB0L49_02425 [Streptomyces antimycoticus]|uniref:hypothetical protein n=1 Tax=Streptomyces antimycoticus TaxID=68175 RepID=UPI00342EAF80